MVNKQCKVSFLRFDCEGVRWVDPGQLPDTPTQGLPHSPPQWDRGENKKKQLVDQGKDREITCQLPYGQNRFGLGEMNLIYCQLK